MLNLSHKPQDTIYYCPVHTVVATNCEHFDPIHSFYISIIKKKKKKRIRWSGQWRLSKTGIDSIWL